MRVRSRELTEQAHTTLQHAGVAHRLPVNVPLSLPSFGVESFAGDSTGSAPSRAGSGGLGRARAGSGGVEGVSLVQEPRMGHAVRVDAA
jgi:hypothetical protein